MRFAASAIAVLLVVWLVVLHPIELLIVSCFVGLSGVVKSRPAVMWRVGLVTTAVGAIVVALVSASPEVPLEEGSPGGLAFVEPIDDIETTQRATMEFSSEEPGELTVRHTIRIDNPALYELLDHDEQASLEPTSRAKAVEELHSALDGWEINRNTSQFVKLELVDSIELGEIGLIRPAIVAVPSFDDHVVVVGASESKRLVANDESVVVLRAPCNAISSSSPPPTEDRCFGQSAEWKWELGARSQDLTATFVHPYLRSDPGNRLVSLTSGRVFSIVLYVLLLPFLKAMLQPLWDKSVSLFHPKKQPAPIDAGPGLALYGAQIDVDLHEASIHSVRGYEASKSGLLLPTDVDSGDE